MGSSRRRPLRIEQPCVKLHPLFLCFLIVLIRFNVLNTKFQFKNIYIRPPLTVSVVQVKGPDGISAVFKVKFSKAKKKKRERRVDGPLVFYTYFMLIKLKVT